MASEIERRFFVDKNWKPSENQFLKSHIHQSYLGDTGDWAIRIRREMSAHREDMYYLTMKKRTSDIENEEFEFPIPGKVYRDILTKCGPVLDKIRYRVYNERHQWEIDVYVNGSAHFPTIAEVELLSADEEVILPPWVTEEITGKTEYSNYAFAKQLAGLYPYITTSVEQKGELQAIKFNYESALFDVLEAIANFFPKIRGGFARGTGGVDLPYVVDTIRNTGAHFQVSKEENARIDTWLKETVYPKEIERQKKYVEENASDPRVNSLLPIYESCWNDGSPYQGAIGGGLTFQFSPTSIGMVTKVVYGSGENPYELDLTDYDSW